MGSSTEESHQFTRRLAKLLVQGAFIIGGDGEVGTLVELAAAANLNLKIWPQFGNKSPKRVAILTVEGVGYYLLKHFRLMEENPKTAEVIAKLFRVVYTPEAAVGWVCGE